MFYIRVVQTELPNCLCRCHMPFASNVNPQSIRQPRKKPASPSASILRYNRVCISGPLTLELNAWCAGSYRPSWGHTIERPLTLVGPLLEGHGVVDASIVHQTVHMPTTDPQGLLQKGQPCCTYSIHKTDSLATAHFTRPKTRWVAGLDDGNTPQVLLILIALTRHAHKSVLIAMHC